MGGTFKARFRGAGLEGAEEAFVDPARFRGVALAFGVALAPGGFVFNRVVRFADRAVPVGRARARCVFFSGELLMDREGVFLGEAVFFAGLIGYPKRLESTEASLRPKATSAQRETQEAVDAFTRTVKNRFRRRR